MSQERRTIRQEMIQLLTGEMLSARDLSQALRISEREVLGHLPHVAHSVAPNHTLVMEPAVCQQCGFRFRKRTKWRKPSKCPQCRSEHIREPLFTIQAQRER